jgi:hypothetical protein
MSRETKAEEKETDIEGTTIRIGTKDHDREEGKKGMKRMKNCKDRDTDKVS